MKRFIHILVIILSFTGILNAADIDFKVSAPARVSVGERFRLTYQVNADVDDFSPPSFENFSVLSGPNRGQNSSIQIINGKVTQNISISYTYLLVASEEGEFTIAPATAKVKGKEYQTQPKTIRVIKGSQNQAPNSNNQQQAAEQGIKSDDVYVKAIIDKSNLYLGEEAVVTFRLYTKVPISNISFDKLSSFNGFWSIALMDNNVKLQPRSEIINGEEYTVADVQKSAIYPQKSGELEIDPIEITCLAQVQTSRKKRSSNDPFFDSFFNDPFFNNSYRNVELQLKSNPIKLNVKNLPAEGKPNFFNGAVGQYSLGSNIDAKEVNANDAITLKYTISGQGNVDLLPDLNVEFPPDFEVYDPKISNDFKNSVGGTKGSKSFEYLIIPRHSGTFQIPALAFTYFDPGKGKYITLNSDAITINVAKGDGTSASGPSVIQGISKENVTYLGKDIRYIETGSFELKKRNEYFFGSLLYYLLLVIPALLFSGIVLLRRKQIVDSQDIARTRNRKANKLTRKRLKQASQFLKTDKESEFYEELVRALWGYLSDKLLIPLAELSKDRARVELLKYQVDEVLVNELVEILDSCEFARYAPSAVAKSKSEMLKQAEQVLQKLEHAIVIKS